MVNDLDLDFTGDTRRLRDALCEFDVQLRPLLSSMLTYSLPDKRISDVIAMDNVKLQLGTSLLQPLRFGKLYDGPQESTKAAMLVGPPGTGKTAIAYAAMKELEDYANLMVIQSGDLLSRYYGVSESIIDAVFKLADKIAPTVLG